MSILSLIVGLIVLCFVFWAVGKILAAFGIGDPIASVVYVFFVLIVVLWLLGQVGGLSLGSLRVG